MTPRVLVCLEDPGVAHVIAARLMRDGVDGVVVDQPARLVEEARKGAVAVAVQHRYPGGEIGSSLLRQVRVARGEVVPAVVLVSGDLWGPDKLVYERQYKVGGFLAKDTAPGEIADALRSAAGVSARPVQAASLDLDVELHEDEARNEFDISIESQSTADVNAAFDGAFDAAFDDDDDDTVKTVEISKGELQRLKNGAQTQQPNRTIEEMPGPQLDVVGDGGNDIDLSQLPAPGGDNDFDISPPTSVGGIAALPRTTTPAGRTTTPAPATPGAVPFASSTPGGPASVDEGDSMQIQELQRTQAELKKALLAERKARETAQKRVEELETKLTKMGDAPSSSGQGVPADGVFEDLRYPALLARCRAEAFTGAVVMQGGGTQRTVFMKDGLPVAFSSSEPGQRIGKVLVAQGRITDEQYMKAATRMVEKSIKLTDALVELNLIDAESLAVEQRNLTRDQIIAGFEIVQGRFTTNNGAVPDGSTPTFDFGPGEIYVQGYRRYAPTNEMLAAYETLRDKYLVANARLASYRPKLGLSGDDERLLRLLGEALTVEEAVERAQITPEAASRLLAALQALDLVEEWSPGVEQFRSRLRAERQRHAEEIAHLNGEHRAIEDRLLRAFEAALGGRGEAGALSSTLTEARASSAASSSSLPPTSSSTSSSGSSGSTRPPSASMAAPSSSSSSSSSAAVRSERATPNSPPPSATSSRDDSSPSISVSSLQNSASSSSSSNGSSGLSMSSPPMSTSSASTTLGGETKSGSGLSSLSSTLSAAAASSPSISSSSMAAATMAPPNPPAPSREDMSPADRKYRDGVEQASQDRLDEAEVTLREAVRLDATRPEYLTALARVLLANPRYERAGTLPVVRSLLDRAVTLAPDHVEATTLHKEVLAEMG